MAEAETAPKRSFMLSPTGPSSSRQPLEVYHLSHDLRGPLNSVLGFAELLLEGVEGPLTENQEADLSAIHQSARNLLHLINAMVDLSKLEANRLKLEFEPVDLPEVVQNVLAYDYGTNKPQDVELVAALPATLPQVWAAGDRVEQMVMSLLRFGFKWKAKRLSLGADSNGQAVTLKVGLEGVTLTATQLAELFELIVHVDATGRSELGPGGLDLPLTRRLAEAYNGRIWVESAGDAGTTFYLRLPLAEKRNSS